MAEDRGEFSIASGMWSRGISGRAKFEELDITWHWLMMEGEGEIADHECGPECICWRKDEGI
jgi:hypothetical protein